MKILKVSSNFSSELKHDVEAFRLLPSGGNIKNNDVVFVSNNSFLVKCGTRNREMLMLS